MIYGIYLSHCLFICIVLPVSSVELSYGMISLILGTKSLYISTSSRVKTLMDSSMLPSPSRPSPPSSTPKGRKSAHKEKNPLISTVLWLLYDFLSVKNDANVPSKSKKQKTIFLVDILEGPWRKEQDSEPDPFLRGRDSRIQICHGSGTLVHTNTEELITTSNCWTQFLVQWEDDILKHQWALHTKWAPALPLYGTWVRVNLR